MGRSFRSGQAHSPQVADAAAQNQFGFDRGEETDLHLPRCEMTGATSDAHLVVYGEGSGIVAKLLGPEPRFVLQKVPQLSVPVTVLSLDIVSQLETAQKLPLKSAAAATLREWFRQDFESAWDKLQKENTCKQGCCRWDRIGASCRSVKRGSCEPRRRSGVR